MRWEGRKRNAAAALREHNRAFGWRYLRAHVLVILLTCVVMFVVLVVGSGLGLID